MIGDWVLWCDINPNTDGSHDLCFNPHKITMDDFVWFYENDYDESEKLAFDKPIPLTADILKANGWKKDTTNSVSKRFLTSQDTYLDITYYEKDNVLIVIEWMGSIQVSRFCNKIRFVHQLQQAFRLCGWKDLADNFKIEL